MKSPYKKIVVYDLETGGLKSDYNSITEIAMVCIDLENLEIVDEMSVMMLPYLDLRKRDEDSIDEARSLYKMISEKDVDTGKKVLLYKGEKLTLQTLDILIDDIEKFESEILSKSTGVVSNDDLDSLLLSDLKDISQLYFDKSYTKGAFEATHMDKNLLLKEGIPREEASLKIKEFLEKHTEGNSKPILAGHNIKKFDNPFLESFLDLHKIKMDSLINQTQMIDTLEWSRLRWFDMPSYALGVVANEVGVTLKDAHRALPDTVANAKYLIKLLQSFRGEGTQQSTYVRKKYSMDF